jgi:hypothetical protein
MTVTTRHEHRLHESVAIARSMLENALLSLRSTPRALERGSGVSHLGEAIEQLTKLGKSDLGDPSFLDLLESASTRVSQASSELSSHRDQAATSRLERSLASIIRQLRQCRRRGIDLLVARQDEMIRAQVGKPAGRAEAAFRASTGVPSLHALPLLPRVVLLEGVPSDHEPLDQDDDLDETPEDQGEATAPDADGGVEPGAVPPVVLDHMRWIARDCLSDLATLSNLRRPLDDQPWTMAESFEQRLLAALDALLALGRPAPAAGLVRGWNVLEEAQRYGTQSYVPDNGRQFARAFALSCVAGEEGVRAALMALRQADPKTHPGFRDALKLAPNQAIGPLVTELLGKVDKPLVSTALEVLRFRRETTFAALVPLTAHPDPAISAGAARALGYLEVAPGVLETLQHMLEEDDDDTVCVEVAMSLLLQGSLRGLAVAREKLVGAALLSEKARLGHLRLIALAGAASDLQLFHECLAATPRDAELTGWFGHTALVPWLLSTLEQANAAREPGAPVPHPLEVAAARALERITGAGLREPVAEHFAYDFDTSPALSAESWKRWWVQNGSTLAPGGKHRFGKPHGPRSTIEELSSPAIHRDRIEAALELAVLTGPSRFEPDDWIARQHLVLSALDARLAAAHTSYPAGRWPGEEVGRRSSYLG